MQIQEATELDYQLDQFTEDQRSRIYRNVSDIELTDGCSNGCSFCGADSTTFTGKVIPFSTLERIAEEMVELTNRTTHSDNRYEYQAHKPHELLLYGATDPLDYEDGSHNYFDALGLFKKAGFDLFTSTAIPKGKEELAIEHLDEIGQISISHMNRERLAPYFEQLGISVYIDLFNYKVLKGEISKSSDSVRQYWKKVDKDLKERLAHLREFEEKLPEETRFYDVRIDGNKPRHNVQDGQTLFLFCADDFAPSLGLGKVRDRDFSGALNIGRSFDSEKYENLAASFGATNGTKITPNGVFNVFSIKPTPENKKGKIIEKVNPTDFKVIRLEFPTSRADPMWDKIEWHYA